MIEGRTSESLRLATALGAATLLARAASGGGGVLINEIRIDQPGTDDDEYFELVADPGTALDDLTYVVIGDAGGSTGSGVIEHETALDGLSVGGTGFFVVAEASFSLGPADVITSLNFENSDNVTHLLVTGFTGFIGQDLDIDDDGELDVTPWDVVVDLIAVVEEGNPPLNTEYHYGPPDIGPDGSSVPWHAFRCDPEATWTIGSQGAGFDDTPGAANVSCPPSCGMRLAQLPALTFGRETTAQAQAAISIDGVYDDWSDVDVAYEDATGDGAPVDFGRVWMADDDEFLFVRIELGDEIVLSDGNGLRIYLDTDDDPCTGKFVEGIGAELEWQPGLRRGTFRFQDQEATVFHSDLRFRAAPGFGADEFEFAFGRDSRPDGINRLFQGPDVKVVVRNEPEGDRVPDPGDSLTFVFDQGDPPVDVAIPIEREHPDDFRFSAFNVLQDGPWDPGQGPRFGRLLAAADPEIVVLCEIYGHTAAQTRVLMDGWIPDRTWRVVENDSFRDVKIAAAYPILATWEFDGNLAALVDTTAALGTRSLVIGAHLPCCDNDEGRQREVDRIMAFVRDAQTPGGDLNLPEGTPIFIAGDLNLVGLGQQFRTLTTGDIGDESTYGPDFDPDWDDTPLTNVIPRQTELRMGWTWRRDNSTFWPGQLDKIIYTDSVITHGRSFTIYTPEMSPANLSAYGLFNTDSLASDHLLLTSDFRVTKVVCSADLNNNGDVGFGDLLLLLSAWGPCAGCPEDIDGDDAVDFDDLLLLLAAWGPCE